MDIVEFMLATNGAVGTMAVRRKYVLDMSDTLCYQYRSPPFGDRNTSKDSMHSFLRHLKWITAIFAQLPNHSKRQGAKVVEYNFIYHKDISQVLARGSLM